eukprot:364013-Chlamydomonas_euryale.AAC.7
MKVEHWKAIQPCPKLAHRVPDGIDRPREEFPAGSPKCVWGVGVVGVSRGVEEREEGEGTSWLAPAPFKPHLEVARCGGEEVDGELEDLLWVGLANAAAAAVILLVEHAAGTGGGGGGCQLRHRRHHGHGRHERPRHTARLHGVAGWAK